MCYCLLVCVVLLACFMYDCLMSVVFLLVVVVCVLYVLLVFWGGDVLFILCF